MNNKKNKIKKSASDTVIGIICTVVSLAFLAAFLYPIIYIVIRSVSTPSMQENVDFSDRFSFEGYIAIFKNNMIIRSFFNSVLYTAVGTLVSMAVSIVLAYVTSIKGFGFGKFVFLLLVVSNYFSGGMIPTYLLIKDLGLLNTMWSLILPSAVSTFNVFLLSSYFKTRIPSELFDAASLDGCGYFRYLVQFVVPLSKPIIIVVSIFYAVSKWNSYFDASIYITDITKKPFANILNDILVKNQLDNVISHNISNSSMLSATEISQLMDHALIVVSIIPIVFIVMFFKKHFINFTIKSEKKDRQKKKGR